MERNDIGIGWQQAFMSRPHPEVVERGICRNDLFSQLQCEDGQACCRLAYSHSRNPLRKVGFARSLQNPVDHRQKLRWHKGLWNELPTGLQFDRLIWITGHQEHSRVGAGIGYRSSNVNSGHGTAQHDVGQQQMDRLFALLRNLHGFLSITGFEHIFISEPQKGRVYKLSDRGLIIHDQYGPWFCFHDGSIRI